MQSALLLAVLLVPGDAFSRHKLGGPRQVVAMVGMVGDDYVVRLRMVAVTAFDDATNARLNRLKAEQFALQALARHLSSDKQTRFEISGGRVVASAKDGKAYTLTFRVPQENVALVGACPDTPPAKPGRVRFAFDTPFFTRKRDLIDTAKQLADSLRTDLTAAEKKVAKTPESVEAFLIRVAELEETAEKHWKTLRAEVRADRLLLTPERDEVLDSLKEREASWARALAAAAKKYVKGDE
jgi:hypothetical protein